MALIPYTAIPELPDPALTPGGALAGHQLLEFYCGDARCDCATATMLVDGRPLLVDLGTGRVDVTGTQHPDAPHLLAQRLLRDALRTEGAWLGRMRAHYAAARAHGLREHYRYVDWTRRTARDRVLWEEIFRQDGGRPWPLQLSEPRPGKGDGKGKGKDRGKDSKDRAEEPAAVTVELILHDAYCVDRGCDCHKGLFVVDLRIGDKLRRLGNVEVDLRTGEPKVVQHEPSMDPNQLFMMMLAAQQQNQGLLTFYADRYQFVRGLLIPVIAQQRRQRTEFREAQPQTTPGRNDPCPCGSGKKFKKCHGA